MLDFWQSPKITFVMRPDLMWVNNLPRWAAKIACAIFCADFLTMLLMNTLRLYTQWLPVLFFSIFIAFVLCFSSNAVIPANKALFVSAKEQILLVLLVLGISLIFAGLRTPYLLEGNLHHLVGPVVYDDTWHFSEINSLVNTVRYPAHYSLIPSQYFSLYYAPWMLISALYLAFPIHGFTIKCAFFLGCAIYQVLVGLTLLHVAMNKANSRRHLYWALYLIGFWAGISSLFALIIPMKHNAVWMACFGMTIEFFNYFVLSTWAIHHLSAAGAVILSWYIWDGSQTKGWKIVGCCSLLIGYTFYSSIFVFIGALPIGIFLAFLSLRNAWKSVLATLCISMAIIWPIVWIYLNKPKKIGFHIPFITSIQFTSRKFPFVSAVSGGEWFGFIIFLILLSINFWPHIFALVSNGKNLDWKNRIFIALSFSFLLSTYFVGFPEGNSYASRGTIVPLMVLGWICAELLPEIKLRTLVFIGLLFGALGSIQEEFWAYTQTIEIARVPLGGAYSEFILKMNQDRHTQTAELSQVAPAVSNYPYITYYIEKFVPGGKYPLVTPDYELECAGPHGPWNWQRVSDKNAQP